MCRSLRHIFVSNFNAEIPLDTESGDHRFLVTNFPLQVSLALVAFAGRERLRRRIAHGIEGVGQRNGPQAVVLAVLGKLRIDVEHHGHLALLARAHGLFGEAEAVDRLEIGAGRQRRDVVGRLARGGARGLVGHGVEHGDDLADPDLDLVLLGLELPGQARADIGVEPHRDLARQRRVRRRRGRDLGGAIETGGAAEPVVEGYGGIGRTDHQHHDEAADRGDDRIARQRAARSGLAASRHALAHLRIVFHLSYIQRSNYIQDYMGRTRTAGPLTMVTAKNSRTRTPSASAMAIERWRRLLFCASVRTIPSGFRLSSMSSPCAPYPITGATARIAGTTARTTTSSSRVANSANRYRIEKANSRRVARTACLPSRWR